MRIARYSVDLLLVERDADHDRIVAKVRKKSIVVPAAVSEAVVLIVEGNERYDDHIEQRRIDKWVGDKGGIVELERLQGMIEERNATTLVLLLGNRSKHHA